MPDLVIGVEEGLHLFVVGGQFDEEPFVRGLSGAVVSVDRAAGIADDVDRHLRAVKGSVFLLRLERGRHVELGRGEVVLRVIGRCLPECIQHLVFVEEDGFVVVIASGFFGVTLVSLFGRRGRGRGVGGRFLRVAAGERQQHHQSNKDGCEFFHC